MSLSRIKAILLQELFITRNSLEVLMDIFFFPIINVVVFGYISIFLSGSIENIGAKFLLMGMILWQIVYITQYSISVGSLWNIWARNLSNMFITPLNIKEYLAAHIFSGILKAFLTFIIFSIIAIFIFDFNIYQLGIINLTFYFLNLIVFASSAGIVILAIIFKFGTRLSALAWGLIFLFQPLTAALFPLKVLPTFLQKFALLFPPTFVFEAARDTLQNGGINYEMIGIAFTENFIYLIIAILFFNYMFKKAKDSGQFARNEG